MKKKTEQFKTVKDLQVVINDLISAHRDAKQNRPLGVMFRVQVPPNDPTLYKEGFQGPYKLVEGIRLCDYTFEKSSGFEYVIDDPNAGLSFSRTFSHLNNTRKMLARHANGYRQPGRANVTWWILSECDVPKGLAFRQDPKNKDHYFLAVTERMKVTDLVKKLKLVAFHMNTILDALE